MLQDPQRVSPPQPAPSPTSPTPATPAAPGGATAATESADQELRALLNHLLTAVPEPHRVHDAAAWWTAHQAAAADSTRSMVRAARGGFAADRLGYAFASGYGEALRRLVPEAPTGSTAPAALCATEAGGAHPRSIKTRIAASAAAGTVSSDGTGWVLSGRKQFVTFGPLAQTLLVVATRGTDETGRSQLVVARIPAARAGVLVQPLPELAFIPEIPHASVELKDVPVAADELLPGDGYERYLKPFRTIEDCHVMAALLGWLAQVARRSDWPRRVLQEVTMLLVTGLGLAAAPPLDAAVHVALAGWLERIEELLGTCRPLWAQVDAQTRALWERDGSLLLVAGKARSERLTSAWHKLAPPR